MRLCTSTWGHRPVRLFLAVLGLGSLLRTVATPGAVDGGLAERTARLNVANARIEFLTNQISGLLERYHEALQAKHLRLAREYWLQVVADGEAACDIAQTAPELRTNPKMIGGCAIFHDQRFRLDSQGRTEVERREWLILHP
jgi:transposase